MAGSGRALPVRPRSQSKITVPPYPRSLRPLLVLAAVCSLSGLAAGQGGIMISSGAPIEAGTTACVTVNAPGSSAGSVSATVELNDVVLRSSCSPNENGSFEVCFDVPDGALDGEIQITVTIGGVSATAGFGVT